MSAKQCTFKQNSYRKRDDFYKIKFALKAIYKWIIMYL